MRNEVLAKFFLNVSFRQDSITKQPYFRRGLINVSEIPPGPGIDSHFSPAVEGARFVGWSRVVGGTTFDYLEGKSGAGMLRPSSLMPSSLGFAGNKSFGTGVPQEFRGTNFGLLPEPVLSLSHHIFCHKFYFADLLQKFFYRKCHAKKLVSSSLLISRVEWRAMSHKSVEHEMQ